ncbi:MAG TPA: hypothetical protein VFH94_21220 [Streptomyces sp.]|nr:hypothetical protein [Streptomyces sp.]
MGWFSSRVLKVFEAPDALRAVQLLDASKAVQVLGAFKAVDALDPLLEALKANGVRACELEPHQSATY